MAVSPLFVKFASKPTLTCTSHSSSSPAHKATNQKTMTKYTKKTRQELIEAFRNAIERKREWEQQAQLDFENMRHRRIMVKQTP